MIRYIPIIWNYLTTWACPHKRRFFLTLFALDGPLLTLDFSMPLWWRPVAEYLALIFDPHVGQLIQYTAVVAAIWLTVVRIKHFNKLMKQMDQKPPQND